MWQRLLVCMHNLCVALGFVHDCGVTCPVLNKWYVSGWNDEYCSAAWWANPICWYLAPVLQLFCWGGLSRHGL